MLFRQKRALTLIELLVTIAITAILAALLFPVFAAARAKARQAICLNNEKQMTAAILLYAQDYSDRWIDLYPNYSDNDPALTPYPATGPRWGLSRNTPQITDCLTAPYLHSTAVFFCPIQHRGTGLLGVTGSWNPTYAINALDSRLGPKGIVPLDRKGARWAFCGPFGRLSAQQTHPATTMILWEHNAVSLQCNEWVTTPGHWDAEHHNGFNAAFADGHVKRWTLARMSNQLVCYWDLPIG